MIQLLIFDHDLTLVDSSSAITQAINIMAAELKMPTVTREQTLRYAALPMKDFLAKVWGEWRPEWGQLYTDKAAPLEYKNLRPYKEVADTLLKLKFGGFFLAVASNRQNPKAAMDQTKLSQYFDKIVGLSDGYPPKPDPGMLNALMGRFGVQHNETLYIGDSDIDILTAQAANVHSVGVTTGYFSREQLANCGAWRVIADLTRLLPLVGLGMRE